MAAGACHSGVCGKGWLFTIDLGFHNDLFLHGNHCDHYGQLRIKSGVFNYRRVRNIYFLQVLEYYDFQTERSVFCMCLMTTMISGGGSLLRSLTGFLGQRWSLVRAGRPNFHPKGSSNKWESLKIFCKSFLDLGFHLAQSNPCCTLARK